MTVPAGHAGHAGHTFQVTVGGEPARIRQAARLIAGVVQRAGIPPARFEAIELAVHEALTNAVRHGHRGDPEVPVQIAVAHDDTAVSVCIRDRAMGGSAPPGDGARAGSSAGSRSLDGAPRQDAPPPSALTEHGHGWTLIAACCDEVVWQPVVSGHDGGGAGVATEVVLTWRR